MQQLVEKLLDASADIRYAALYHHGALTSGQRPRLAGATSSESDTYEELIVNPTLLKLVTQRGDIDCGGAKFVIIRYGRFFQLVRPTSGGHLSVAIEPYADPLNLLPVVEKTLSEHRLL